MINKTVYVNKYRSGENKARFAFSIPGYARDFSYQFMYENFVKPIKFEFSSNIKDNEAKMIKKRVEEKFKIFELGDLRYDN